MPSGVFQIPWQWTKWLAIPPADDRAGALDRDRPLRRKGAAVPRRMKAVRRCGRHDVPEGIACPAPQHHEASDTAPIRESVGDGHIDRMARLKHEMQQFRPAGDHRRALLGNGTGVLDVSHVRHWHPSIRPHDLSGIGPGIARSPAPSLNLGDEFRHHAVEQGWLLQV